VTTLLDATQYPSTEIVDLYLQRWDVELFFRDIKTTMDVLRCQTSDMIRIEILMYFIAHNCIDQRQLKLLALRPFFQDLFQKLRRHPIFEKLSYSNPCLTLLASDHARLSMLVTDSVIH